MQKSELFGKRKCICCINLQFYPSRRDERTLLDLRIHLVGIEQRVFPVRIAWEQAGHQSSLSELIPHYNWNHTLGPCEFTFFCQYNFSLKRQHGGVKRGQGVWIWSLGLYSGLIPTLSFTNGVHRCLYT